MTAVFAAVASVGGIAVALALLLLWRRNKLQMMVKGEAGVKAPLVTRISLDEPAHKVRGRPSRVVWWGGLCV